MICRNDSSAITNALLDNDHVDDDTAHLLSSQHEGTIEDDEEEEDDDDGKPSTLTSVTPYILVTEFCERLGFLKR